MKVYVRYRVELEIPDDNQEDESKFNQYFRNNWEQGRLLKFEALRKLMIQNPPEHYIITTKDVE